MDSDDSISIFDKSQNLQEVGDSTLTYCDMNIEIDEYHDITIRFSSLCRICGESALDGIDIFATRGIELRLKEKISLHMPISIDMSDSMPQKVCTDCCNKLNITHSLVVSCLRTDMRLKRFLNISREPAYEDKYDTLVKECSLEIAREICTIDTSHSNSASFTINKMVNPDLETSLEELENGEFPGTQSDNFENIAKSVAPSDLNTMIQTYKKINRKNEDLLAGGMSQTRDRTQNKGRNILCLQCQTICETQEMFENHKIFCVKEEDIRKRTIASGITRYKHRNETVNFELGIKNSQTDNRGLESKRLIDKLEIREPVQSKLCTSGQFETRQDLDDHERLRVNLTENTAIRSSKRCGHCKEIYRNKKDLLNHITQSHEGRLLFRCFTCDRTYEKYSSLDIHEATHRLDKPYLCDLCGKSFKHSNNLRGHKRIHLDESIKKRHVCEVCGSAFRSRFHLREHKNQHDGNRPYSCEQCGKAFCKRIQLRQHKLSHGSNRHACPICGAMFNRRGNMNTHVKRHNNQDGMYTCSVCTHKCKSMSELKAHRKKHTEKEIVDSIRKRCVDKEIWRCNVCGKVFSKRAVLTNHERTHRDDKFCIECDECGKKLSSKSSLMYHKKSVHLREKPHMCHYCGESFVSREARLVHERIHTGERPYVCSVCNTRYRCSSNLSQHMKIHTGVKPHKCRYCGKSFTRNGALTVHERVHTGVKPYTCEICGRSFTQKNDMLKHAKTHDSKSMQCNQCNEIFKRKRDMLRHITMHERGTSATSDYVDPLSCVLRPSADSALPSGIE